MTVPGWMQEMKSEMEKEAAINQANTAAKMQAFQDLMSALDNDQLVVLQDIIGICGDKQMRGTMLGLAASTFMLSRGCNHDGSVGLGSILKEGADQAETPPADQPLLSDLDDVTEAPFWPEHETLEPRRVLRGNAPGFLESASVLARSDDEIAELHAEWGLRIDETFSRPTLRCENCGVQVVSLSDRMLRPKGLDGCEGCMAKSAQG